MGKNKLLAYMRCFRELEIRDKDFLEKLNNQIVKRKNLLSAPEYTQVGLTNMYFMKYAIRKAVFLS